MNLGVRVATVADAPAIAVVEAVAAATPWDAEAVGVWLAGDTTVCLVAGDPIVGHVIASVVLDSAEILSLAVHPAHRRRGVARALLSALTKSWRQRGVRQGLLEVRADNTPALALYAGLGWVECAIRRRYYRDGTHALVMRWVATEEVG